MHVLILPSWYFPAGTQEIAGRMFHQLALGLRESGMDARVFYADHSRKGPFFKKTSFQTEEGVPTWRVSQWFPPKANHFLYTFWIRRYVKDLEKYFKKVGKPDLIHAQSYMAASVCAALQEKIKIPFIYTERLSGFVLGKISKPHQAFIGKSFAHASAITCVSPGLLDLMQPHSQKNIRVIPNFFDEQFFYIDTNTQKNPAFTWVSVGEPAQIKGLDILLQAFAGLKQRMSDVEMKLVLIDRIPEEEELKKMARELKIENHLTWTGLISQVDIGNILRQSHVLVSASRVETFGKAIIEAQACGLPIVATKTDGAEYIVTSAHQGELADIGSPESLMRAMGKAIVGYSTYNAQTIHSVVEKRFSKKVVIDQWIKLYKSLQP